ncbi:tetratricopeptide repeat protein [Oscillatoria amoena NRMC-F 0135]|nr:tetratricopeptide repeat protein [Oscillatoria amoena NRMC-F 0135]
MKNTAMRALAVGLLGMISLTSANAQCKEWAFSEGEAKALEQEKVTLYTDAKSNNNFKQALPPLNWLLKNNPKLNTSIYINGAEIFDKVAAAETDPAKRRVYIDSLLLVHDLRIANCGEEASVTNRKALMAAKYYANEAGKEAYVLSLMDKAVELNGNNTLDGTLVPYMQAIKINKLKLKTLTDDQVLERYDRVMAILDAKTKKAQSEGKPIDRLNTIKADVDKVLLSMITINCDFVRKNLGPKFKANPADIGTAKKIFAFMLQDKCTDDPLWLEAAEAIHTVEKDYGLAKNLAIRYLAAENYAKAEQLFKEALELVPTNSDKADILIYLGALEAKKGNKAGARELYRQALAADGSKKEAYEKIGDLYYQSFPDCAKKENMAADRLVYIAAYEMYQRAGETKKMAMAKDQFPSKEDIFLVNWTAGDTQRVGCWINESVTVKTRD